MWFNYLRKHCTRPGQFSYIYSIISYCNLQIPENKHSHIVIMVFLILKQCHSHTLSVRALGKIQFSSLICNYDWFCVVALIKERLAPPSPNCTGANYETHRMCFQPLCYLFSILLLWFYLNQDLFPVSLKKEMFSEGFQE